MLPSPASDSYGSAEGVAALAMTWTDNGQWLDTDAYVTATNPSLTTVVSWIDQISAMLNTALANYGFVTPLSQAKSISAADLVVNGLVADLARYVNGKGRFFSERFSESGRSVWQTVRADLDAWVDMYTSGLEANGETRINTNKFEVATRGFDEAGNEVYPIFQRDAFGNKFTNWTK